MTNVIIIPAYNPPSDFSHLLQSIRHVTSIPIIIVDDGSYPAVQVNKKYSNTILLINNINQGKGYSLIKAFNFANDHGYSHAITIDCDFQHDPLIIPKFLSIDENITIVCGRRRFKDSMPLYRRLSNTITSIIVSFISDTSIYDSQCGYRRYRIDDVCGGIYKEHGFQFETEVIINLLHHGFSISHINIPTIYQIEKSNVRYFYDTFIFIKLIFRSIFLSVMTK